MVVGHVKTSMRFHLSWANGYVERTYPFRFLFDMDRDNPRRANGTLRRKNRARFKAMNAPCGICKGRLGEIHYDEPSDAQHPLSFVIDEKKPISRWKEFGYASPRAAAEDWNNLQAAHYICNQRKGARVGGFPMIKVNRRIAQDGEW